MIFALVLLFTGCSVPSTPMLDAANGDGPGPDGTPPATEVEPEVPEPPAMTIDTPPPASYLPAGATTVSGTSFRIDSVDVNGTAATMTDGDWSTSVTLIEGMNVLEVIGTTDEGAPYRDIRSALAGTFQQPEGLVDGALQVYLSEDTINGLTPLINENLDPTALEPMIMGLNPVMDDDYLVNAVGIDFGFIDTHITTSTGMMHLELIIHDFYIPLDIDGAPLGVDEGEMQAEQVILHADIALGADADGITVELLNPDISFVEFDFDVNNFLANWFISDGDIEQQLLDTLVPLLNDVNPMIADALDNLELAPTEAELLGQTMEIGMGITDAGVEPGGIYLGVGLDLNVLGAVSTGEGHLIRGLAPIQPVNGIGAQLGDDFMNRFLHELWGGGVLDIDLPIEPTDLSWLLLDALGAPQGQAGGLSLSPALPPVWIERGGEARLQLAEVAMVADTPGGEFGDQVELLMTLDARAEIEINADAFGIVLSDAQVKMVPRGAQADNPALIEKMPDVEVLMGAGMGAINEMLSFPLTDLDITQLPVIGITRDSSGKATNIALEDLDIDSMVPDYLKHMVYTVPATAIVHDSTEDVEIAGDTHMICDRRTNALADGTWYVGSEGRLVIEAGVHTVYAENDARIDIESADPVEIIADPGVEINDNFGVAILTTPRSVTFDLSTVLPDGCP